MRSAVSRLSHRQRFDLTVGGVVLLIVVALAGGYLAQRRPPTVDSVAAHVNASVRAGQVPKLSDAEIAALADQQRKTAAKIKPRWEDVEVPAGTPVARLDRPGARTLRVGFEDGWLGLSDRRYWVTGHEQDPLDVMEWKRTVVGGGPGEVIVGGCCEDSDARVTVVLRRTAPPLPAQAAWPLASDLDLDLATGTIVLSATGGAEQVVQVPRGRYRLRVVSAGAHENEQERDRYRLELWPRDHDAPLRVWRPVPEGS